MADPAPSPAASVEGAGVGPRRHFGGLESIRAIAALAVVAHHAASLSTTDPDRPFMELAAVGDSGVAVFFVLSGFLIYLPFARRAILDEERPRWREFWWRRVLRIFPAYWLALTFFWVFGAYSLGPNWWRFYLLIQIYDPGDAFNGLTVAWSLATEVAFYLVIPFVAAALERLGASLDRAGRIRLQLACCAGLVALAYLSRYAIEQTSTHYLGVSFQWLPMNADLFAVGMAMAVASVATQTNRSLSDRLDAIAAPAWAWWLSAGGLFAAYAFLVGPTTFEAGYTGWYWQRRSLVLVLISVCLLLPAVFGHQATSRLRTFWSAGAVVWVGTVSYGLYLWHQAWMEWAVGLTDLRWLPTPDPPTTGVVYVAITGLVLGLGSAAASWYGLERPTSRWRGKVR